MAMKTVKAGRCNTLPRKNIIRDCGRSNSGEYTERVVKVPDSNPIPSMGICALIFQKLEVIGSRIACLR
jgi:hypothetical protein